MLSTSYDFQMETFLTTDQYTEINALHAHCLHDGSPKKCNIFLIKITFTDFNTWQVH